MRVVLQRVSRASVRVGGIGGIVRAQIGGGLLLLVGVERGDAPEQAAAAARKICALRVFADQDGKMNLDVKAAGGQVLVVSQFTLAASVERGRRPSFSSATPPEEAVAILAELVARLRAAGLEVAEGEFGAEMKVELVNQGPVTFVLDFPPK